MKNGLLQILTVCPVPSIITLGLPVSHETVLLLETVDGDSLVFVQSVVSLLSSISQYCRLCDQIPQVRHDTVT